MQDAKIAHPDWVLVVGVQCMYQSQGPHHQAASQQTEQIAPRAQPGLILYREVVSAMSVRTSPIGQALVLQTSEFGCTCCRSLAFPFNLQARQYFHGHARAGCGVAHLQHMSRQALPCSITFRTIVRLWRPQYRGANRQHATGNQGTQVSA